VAFENGRLLRVALRAFSPDKGQEMVNTVHYNLDDGGIAEDNDPQALADRIRDDVLPAFRVLYLPSWTIDPVVVTEEIDPLNPGASREQWTSGSSSQGTRSVSGDALPTACVLLHYWNTGLVGRSFRGRMFVGGSTVEADQSDGVWVAAQWAGSVQSYVNAWPLEPDIAPPASEASANLTVYSRTRRAQDLDPYAPNVIGNSRSLLVRWLRSRQPGN
jgi:hypothetical protein